MLASLDGCSAKLARAEELWQALYGELIAFLERLPYRLEGRFEPGDEENHGDWVVRVAVTEAPPLRWSVVMGEIVHDLRSALDHLAWQLVLLDGGQPTRSTQFPIYRVEADFRAPAGQSRLTGMSDAHHQQLEELQPFRHDDPDQHHLAVLAYLSNTDKHQVLHTALVENEGSQFGFRGVRGLAAITGEIQPSFGPLVDGAEIVRVPIEIDAPNPQIETTAQLQLDVTFADADSPVNNESALGVLQELYEFVRDGAVARFASDFP